MDSPSNKRVSVGILRPPKSIAGDSVQKDVPELFIKFQYKIIRAVTNFKSVVSNQNLPGWPPPPPRVG